MFFFEMCMSFGLLIISTYGCFTPLISENLDVLLMLTVMLKLAGLNSLLVSEFFSIAF